MKRKLFGIWRRTLRRLGHSGIATGILTICTLGLCGLAVELNAQGSALRQRTQASANAESQVKVDIPVKRASIGQQIDSFVDTFPALSQSPKDLGIVFQSAKRRDIRLLKGDYQFKGDIHSGLVTLTATFPVSAAYGTTKEFVADVLRGIPNASMDELHMTRSASNVAVLESSLRFSFVYRRP